MNEQTARKIVRAIIEDMTDRRGLRQAWDDVDSDVQSEIHEEWVKIVLENS